MSEAAFLDYPELGTRAIPWLQIARAGFSIPLVAFYSAFADRVSNDRLLAAIMIFSMIGCAVGLSLIGTHLLIIAYPLLFLIMLIPLDDIFWSHWYTYAGDFFDTRSVKRIFPVLSTAMILGGVVAGFSMPFLNTVIPSDINVSVIVSISMFTLGITALIAWKGPDWLKIPRPSTKQTSPSFPLHDQPAGTQNRWMAYLKDVFEGYHYVVHSSFLRWMAASTLLVMIMLAILEYYTAQILVDTLRSKESIASFTAIVVGISNILLLPIQLFLMGRIISRVGVGAANLLFPVGNLAICGGLIAVPGLATAGLAYFSRVRLYGSIGYLTDSLLYNAIPMRVKARSRAFIGGIVLPIGIGIGGCILLLVPLVPWAWFPPILIMLLAVAYLGTTLVIRKKYAQALITMLEEEDYSFLLSSQSANLTAAGDPATLNALKKRLEESTSDEMTIFVAKLISQVGGNDAIPILEQAARESTSPYVRSAILDIFNAADVRSDDVRFLYTDFLNDSDSQVRQSALAVLEDVYEKTDPQYLQFAVGMLADPEVDVRIQALVPLLTCGNPEYQHIADESLDELLHSDSSTYRASGLQVIGQTSSYQFLSHLIEALEDPADEVRLQAALALEGVTSNELTDEQVDMVCEQVRSHIHDPVERVRLAVLVILGKLDSRDTSDAFLQALTDSSPRVRTIAVDTLVEVGKAWEKKLMVLRKTASFSRGAESTRLLQEHQSNETLGRAVMSVLPSYLESDNRQLQTMVTVVLSRINREQYGSRITTSINDTLYVIYQLYHCIEALSPLEHHASVAIIQSALYEHNQQLLDEIFFLLAAINDSNEVKIVAEALRSETLHVRANATEALESFTSPKIAWLIEPLYNPNINRANLLDMGREMWGMARLDTVGALNYLLAYPHDSWFRAMTAFALGDIGRGLEPQPAPPPENKPDRRSKRRGGGKIDVFAALDSPTKETDSQPEPHASKTPTPSESGQASLLTRGQLDELIQQALNDPVEDVRLSAQAAQRTLSGQPVREPTGKEDSVLSTIERIIFLKGVPFFQGMTIEQLKILATVCEERIFAADVRIFNQGDTGGTLYVVISGRVAIEQEKRAGYFARVATIEAHSYFGEANLFDNSPHDVSALAVQDTLTLQVRREPLIMLARQYPDLSLELIKVLSQRLRESNARIADLTRSRPRELHKLFDQFE
jgi:HEAT repeat protein